MNVDPSGMTAQQWTGFSTLALSSIASVPVLLDDSDWKAWANAVIQSPKVSAFLPPDPRYFEDWREWATRFNQAVPL